MRGAGDVKVEAVAGLPQLQIKPDRAAIARYGLNVAEVNDLVEPIVAVNRTGLVYEGEQRFNLVVRFMDEASRDVDTIKNLLIPAPHGVRVPLFQVADVAVPEGPAQISREDTRRRIVSSSMCAGATSAALSKRRRQPSKKQVTLPAGYYTTWGGQFENLQRASARLLVVVPLALFLIFVLLFTTFGSVRQALLVYTGIPFAIVGGVLALAVRGMPFSISAGVGFIALWASIEQQRGSSTARPCGVRPFGWAIGHCLIAVLIPALPVSVAALLPAFAWSFVAGVCSQRPKRGENIGQSEGSLER